MIELNVSVTEVEELEVNTVPAGSIHWSRSAVPLLSTQLTLTDSPAEYIANRVMPVNKLSYYVMPKHLYHLPSAVEVFVSELLALTYVAVAMQRRSPVSLW